MPKICNDRPEGSSYGLSRDTRIELYLDCALPQEFKQQEHLGRALIDLRTLAALYVVKFSKIWQDLPFKILFCPVKKPDAESFAFSLDLDAEKNLDYSLTSHDTDCATGNVQIHDCLFPAVFVPEKNLCITGLCSVVRFLLRNTVDQIDGHSSRGLLGYMGMSKDSVSEICAKQILFGQACN